MANDNNPAEVKKLERDHINACSLIEEECFQSEAMSREDLLIGISDPDKDFFAAVTEDGQAVGLSAILASVDSADILTIAVKKEKRRTGIGRLLLNAIIDASRTRGCHSVFLEVRSSNETAVEFYKKYGFTCINTRKNYYREPVEDAVIMKLNLD